MAAGFGNNLEINQHQLIAAVFENRLSDPTNAVEGQYYWKTVPGGKKLLVFDSTLNEFISIAGDITGVTTETAGQLQITSEGGPIPVFNIKLAAIASGAPELATGGQIYSFVTSAVDNGPNNYVNGGIYDATLGKTTLSRQGLNALEITGFPTQSTSQSFTNKSGSNSQWDNDEGYLKIVNAYDKWNLKTEGIQRLGIVKEQSVDFVGGTNMSISYGAGGVVTFNSTDTNTNDNAYTNAVNFNSSNGILSFSGVGGQPNYQANLDGRYAIGSGSGSYIQNQDAVDQAANFKINGNGQFGGNINASRGTFSSYLDIESGSDSKINLRVPSGDSADWNYISFYGSDGVRDSGFGTNQSGIPVWFNDNSSKELKLGNDGVLTYTGEATFNSTVSATKFIGDWNGGNIFNDAILKNNSSLQFERDTFNSRKFGINSQGFYLYDVTRDELVFSSSDATGAANFVSSITATEGVFSSAAGNVKIISTAGGANLFLDSQSSSLSRIRWNGLADFAIRDDAKASDRFRIDTNGHAYFSNNTSAKNGYFSKDIIGDGSAYLKKIWGGSNGGIIELKTDANTVNRYSRIGISDSNGNWTGGLTILDSKKGVFDNSMETKLGIFRDSGSVDTPLTVIQAFNTIPYNVGNGKGEAVIEIGHLAMHGYIQSGSFVETDSSKGYMSFGHRAEGNIKKEAFRISDDTRVLINTGVSNGIDQLQVNGSGKFSSNLTTEGTVLVNAGYDIGFALLGGFKISRQNGYTRFDQNNLEVFRLNSNLSTEFVSSITATDGIFNGQVSNNNDENANGSSFRVSTTSKSIDLFAYEVEKGGVSYGFKIDGRVTAKSILLDSGEYLSWGTVGSTSIEGSTTSNKLRFRTNGVQALSLNEDQSATFASTVSSSIVPTADAHLTNKLYVDGLVLGSGIYVNKGDYNAGSNSPKLDSDGSDVVISGLKNGHTYKVVAAGVFYSEESGGVQLRPGDVLTAKQDNPSQISHWTIVQGNIDFATYTAPGIASFSSSNFSVGAEGQVVIKAGGVELGTHTTGAYVRTLSTGAGLDNTDANNNGSNPQILLKLSELTSVAPTTTSYFTGTNAAGTNRKFTVQSILDLGKEIITMTGNGSTKEWVLTHSFGIHVIAQVVDSSGNTFFLNAIRTANDVTFKFDKAPANGVTFTGIVRS